MSRLVRAACWLALGPLALAPARGSDLLWQGPATAACRIALEDPIGPVAVSLHDGPPELRGEHQRMTLATAVRDGTTVLTLERTGTPTAAGVPTAELAIPAACGLDVTTRTGTITLWVGTGLDLAIRLATSGEITTDFSIAIDYRRHSEPAKLGSIDIGTGATELRLNSRQGGIRVLRARP